MMILRQLLSFGAIGIIATLTHVSCTWVLIESVKLNPFASNTVGALTAFAISMFGNYALTFPTDRSLVNCARRYIVVSLGSLVMTSAILLFVRRYIMPTEVYVLLVLILVPPATFLLAKFWAFRPLALGQSKKRSDGGRCSVAIARHDD